MRLPALFSLASVFASAAWGNVLECNLNDMPEAFLWHLRSVVQRIEGEGTLRSPISVNWHPDKCGASTPPGSLVLMLKGDFIGDEKPEFAFCTMLETENSERRLFLCSSEREYLYSIPTIYLCGGGKEGDVWRGEAIMNLPAKPSAAGTRWMQWELGPRSARAGIWVDTAIEGRYRSTACSIVLHTRNGEFEGNNSVFHPNSGVPLHERIAKRMEEHRKNPTFRTQFRRNINKAYAEVYATTLHELLTSSKPAWVQVRSFYPNSAHFEYRDALNLENESTKDYLTPKQALQKLNEYLGIEKVTPTQGALPCPLFPTLLTPVKNLPFNPPAVYQQVDEPTEMPTLPTLQTAPPALLQHLYHASSLFAFEGDREDFPKGSYPGGELHVQLIDIFGDEKPEMLLSYLEPEYYGERPEPPLCLIFDSQGQYRYMPGRNRHSRFFGWPRYKHGDETRSELNSENFDNYSRESTFTWYQNEQREQYARQVLWTCSGTVNEPDENPTLQQHEMLCTPNGVFCSTSPCHVGRPDTWYFLNFREVLKYVCQSDLRHPDKPYIISPTYRTSLYEFLTQKHPRWVQREVPADMQPAPGTYTDQEAIRVLREQLFPGALPESSEAPLFATQ